MLAQAKMELEKDETRPAIDNLQKVVQLLPDYADGHLLLGQTLSKVGDLTAALWNSSERWKSIPTFTRRDWA